MLAQEATEVDELPCQIREMIDASIRAVIDDCPITGGLKDAVCYSLFPGGKRIRPAFALMLFHDCGGAADLLVRAASSLEIVHSSTLVHDDLPAIDNDEMRRGKPSLHVAFGEAAAILVGDLLIPLAFEGIASSSLGAEVRARLLFSLSQAYRSVCHGQYLDTLPPSSSERPAVLENLHRLKTGSLFQAAAEFAAIALEVPEAQLQAFGRLGNNVGLYFQVVDDLIDAFGSDKQRGRVGSSDARGHKRTFFTENSGEHNHKVVSMKESLGREFLRLLHMKICDDFHAIEMSMNVNLRFARKVIEQVHEAEKAVFEKGNCST